MSPYLTHGLITLTAVLEHLLVSHTLPIQHKLVFELGWRAYFRHVWSHAGEGILTSFHAGACPDESYAQALPEDIRQARTGVPVVDQAVRTLYATGYLHNHARMWLASYVVHIRHIHWRAGADWMVAHLLDGDLASNHLSWQWVAGTGSHKPYLFNADNVARHAPQAWHSPGTVIDQSYDALDRMARTTQVAQHRPASQTPLSEPCLQSLPPDDLPVRRDLTALADQVRGRDVWLVHPWALRPGPVDLPAGTILMGLYPAEHHRRWPWPQSRWRWIDAAMSAVTPHRVIIDQDGLIALASEAASLQTVHDPHLPAWMTAGAVVPLHVHPAPSPFPDVSSRCESFSRWWGQVTQGRRSAADLFV